MDAPAGITRDEGHTRLLHLPSAVLALISIARRIQSPLSLVNRQVELHFQQSRVWTNRVWLPRSAEQETCFLPSPSSRLKVWFCEMNSAISSRVSLLIIHSGSIWYLLAGFLLLSATSSTIIPLIATGSAPSSSGHANACKKRLLPRILWHRVSSPQGSSSKGYCLCRKADQPKLCVARFPRIYFFKVRDKAPCTIRQREVPVSPVVGVCYVVTALVKPLSSCIVGYNRGTGNSTEIGANGLS